LAPGAPGEVGLVLPCGDPPVRRGLVTRRPGRPALGGGARTSLLAAEAAAVDFAAEKAPGGCPE
jgi:hypothetical protein